MPKVEIDARELDELRRRRGIVEGMKSGRWLSANLNDTVRFKLRPRGRAMWEEKQSKYPEEYRRACPDILQMWELANVFGAAMFMGGDPPIETQIEIEYRPAWSDGISSASPVTALADAGGKGEG